MFGASSYKNSHRLIVVPRFDLPQFLLIYTEFNLLYGREMLFSPSEGGEYILAGFAKLLDGLLSLLFQVQSLAGEHNAVDFHLVGGWIAARGGFSHIGDSKYNNKSTTQKIIPLTKYSQEMTKEMRSFLHSVIELLVALISLLLLADYCVDLISSATVQSNPTVPLPPVVEIVEFSLNLVHSCAGQFHQGQEERLVCCIWIEIALPALKVLGIDLKEQFSPVGTQMAELLLDLTIQIALLLRIRVLLCDPLNYQLIRLALMHIPIVVRVDNPCLLGLIGPVEHLQRVPAYQLIITIHVQYYRIVAAVIHSSKVEVGKCSESQEVLYVGVALFADGVVCEIVAIDLVAAIRGGVFDDYDLVVGVILGEDGVEVGLDAELGVVVEARHEDAHRQFFGNCREIELGLEPQPILLISLDCVLLLFLAVDKVVLGEMQGCKSRLRVKVAKPLIDQFISIEPSCLIFVENVLDPKSQALLPFALFVLPQEIYGQRLILLGIGDVDDDTGQQLDGRRYLSASQLGITVSLSQVLAVIYSIMAGVDVNSNQDNCHCQQDERPFEPDK